MSDNSYCILEDRGVVSVSGEDAEKLLQGLVTNDMAGLAVGQAVFAALLSPQGKIQFDFIAVRTAGGFLLDVTRDKAAELVKRLTLYRLRSKAEIADASADFTVGVQWGGGAAGASDVVFRDPRLSGLGTRYLRSTSASGGSGQAACEADYHAHRIALGVPEGGRDYAFGDTFPHEALLDQLNGVSFSKGCYVGQEIVSRMQHRGTARKRIVPVHAAVTLPATGTPVTAGEVEIGTLGSTAGGRGLALVRLDRAAEFTAKGVAIFAGAVPIVLERPEFATFALEQPPAGAPLP